MKHAIFVLTLVASPFYAALIGLISAYIILQEEYLDAIEKWRA